MKTASKQLYFVWQGIQQQQICRGTIHAENHQQALLLLRKQGITVYKLKKQSLWRQGHWRKTGKIKAENITTLLVQLAHLLSAGIDLITALSMLAKQHQKSVMATMLSTVINALQNGLSLSQSLNTYPQYFDPLSCQLIAAGEQSGKLDTMLHYAAKQRRDYAQLKSNIISACLYPSMLVITAITITSVLLIVVIPKFAIMFTESNITLPYLTKVIITLSQWTRAYGSYAIILGLALLLAIYLAKKYSTYGNLYLDFLLLKLPVFGKLIEKAILTRCLQTFSMAFSAGISLPKVLTICSQVADNKVFYWAYQQLHLKTQQGLGLAASMTEVNLFPTLMVEMTAGGEQSGKLCQMLEQLSQYYHDDIQRFIKRLNYLLEPIIMLILGVLIGILLLAMYLPIFKLGMVVS
ncbi:MAG: type II secretion system F family protein [Pseudomonadota bacterium]